jgi:apolipoprotein N-acyltransferase
MASFLPVKKVEFGAKFIENKALLIDPNGKILSFFFKNKPVPVVEPSVAGDGNVPVSTTEFGTLATSICYDADFPQLMRQAGQKNADVLLLPSGDWKEVSPYHGDMAKMRAVENGFSLVRCVSGARSSVYDFYGQLISARNFFDSGEKVLVAYVPMKGVQTVYSFIGDSWVAVCGFLLIVLVVIAWQSHQKSKANIRPPAGSLSITS